MAYTKAKVAVVGAVALLLVGGTGVGVSYYVLRDSGSLTGTKTADVVKPPPARTAVASPKFTWLEPPQPARVPRPYQGPHVVGYARTVDGSPVSGAEAILSYVDRLATLRWGVDKAYEAPMVTMTGADGRFEFAPAEEPVSVVIRNEQGIGSANVSVIASSGNVVLEPWGRVEGVYRIGSKPLVKDKLTVKLEDQGPGFPSRGYIFPRRQVVTDELGRFVVDHVPPGRRLQVGIYGTTRVLQHYHGFDVAGGTTTRVVAGGGGRSVVGRVASVPGECDVRLATLLLKPQQPPVSEKRRAQLADQARKVHEQMQKAPEFQGYQTRELLENQFIVRVNGDGQFRIEDVLPGQYQLKLQFAIADLNLRAENVASVEADVTVAAPPNGDPDEPQNLGTLPLTFNKRIAVGEQVPDLAASGLDGQRVKLSDSRGKYVLLSIVSGADDNCLDAMKMTPIHDRFAGDPRLVFLMFNEGGSLEVLKKAADQNSIGWPLFELDSKSSPALEAYLSSEQSLFLIDPAGRLAAKNLNPQRAYYAIDRALSRPASRAAGIVVRTERLPATAAAPAFLAIPRPVSQDRVMNGQFSIVDGLCGVDSGLLHDGQLQQQFDDPDRSFRFQLGTLEGRVKIDLFKTVQIAEVSTYSRHNRDRAPQLYTLYASNGGSGFNASPMIGTDPSACGWTKVATVDTRPESGQPGGWYGASVSGDSGAIGSYRYLLFEMFPTETVDAYGHTFYGEIQVIERR